MNKYTLILLTCFLLIISSCSNQTDNNNITQNNTEKIEKKLSENELLFEILKTNKDGQDYLNNYKNVQIVNKIKIYPNEFETLKNNTQFKAIYENLPEKELYYVEFKSEGSLQLMTIIDIKEKKVINIIGKIIMGMG